MLVIICGRSGSGKSTMERLLSERMGFNVVISTTTREIRENEVKGVNYHFVSLKEFEQLRNENKLIEDNSYLGNYYGIESENLTDRSVAVVEFNGAKQIKERLKKAGQEEPVIIYLDASDETVSERIPDRLDRVRKDKEIFTVEKYKSIGSIVIDANRELEKVYVDIENNIRERQ